MDSGEGNFKRFEKTEELKSLQEEFQNHGGVFSVGDEIPIRGSLFKVSKITPKKLILRLQPKPE